MLPHGPGDYSVYLPILSFIGGVIGIIGAGVTLLRRQRAAQHGQGNEPHLSEGHNASTRHGE